MPVSFRRPAPPAPRPRDGRPLAAAALALLTGSLVLQGASASRVEDAARGASSPAPRDSSSVRPTVVRCLMEPIAVGPEPCASAVLIEAETGATLWEQDADEPRSPASLVKIMLQLLVLGDVERGTLALTDSVTTSARASRMGGSQVFLKEGEKQTLGALLEAIAISSANDAALAVAEHVGGDEAAFVARMNEEAARLGCGGTQFVNVHGLDEWNRPKNVTTARDVATIARALVEHEHALTLSSTWRAPFRGGEFWLDNTNRLLRMYGGVDGLDGLKTGYTWRAGGCFCGTATRNGVRLISVVMGARPGNHRFLITRELLEAGFSGRPVRWDVAESGEPFALADDVEEPSLDAYAVSGGRVRVILEESRREAVSFRVRPLADLAAPVRAGDRLGYLDCRIDDRTFASLPVDAASDLTTVPLGAPSIAPLAP
jgi:D-alanyl-D-alanine carboxypeptidase (penicillin-binding protein 5/6)